MYCISSRYFSYMQLQHNKPGKKIPLCWNLPVNARVCRFTPTATAVSKTCSDAAVTIAPETASWDSIFNLINSPAYVAWRAGTTTPIPSRFIAPKDRSEIPDRRRWCSRIFCAGTNSRQNYYFLFFRLHLLEYTIFNKIPIKIICLAFYSNLNENSLKLQNFTQIKQRQLNSQLSQNFHGIKYAANY